MTKLQKLEAALKWAITTGAYWPEYRDEPRNSGCGCCSDDLDIPEEFRDVVLHAAGKTSSTNEGKL